MFNASDVAKFIICYGTQHNEPITNLRLQKLLYFIWVDYYRMYKEYLFRDKMYAWQFGPVVPSVYREYCLYGGLPIIPPTCDFSEEYSILCPIIDEYLAKSTGELVSMTHEPGKPWDYVYQQGKGNRQVIPFNLITQLECGCGQ